MLSFRSSGLLMNMQLMTSNQLWGFNNRRKCFLLRKDENLDFFQYFTAQLFLMYFSQCPASASCRLDFSRPDHVPVMLSCLLPSACCQLPDVKCSTVKLHFRGPLCPVSCCQDAASPVKLPCPAAECHCFHGPSCPVSYCQVAASPAKLPCPAAGCHIFYSDTVPIAKLPVAKCQCHQCQTGAARCLLKQRLLNLWKCPLLKPPTHHFSESLG